MREELKQKTDDELQEIISEIESILEARDLQRKKQTMEQIKALAGKVGLNVAVKKQTKRKYKTKTKQGKNNES